jgi:hypothetical protein
VAVLSPPRRKKVIRLNSLALLTYKYTNIASLLRGGRRSEGRGISVGDEQAETRRKMAGRSRSSQTARQVQSLFYYSVYLLYLLCDVVRRPLARYKVCLLALLAQFTCFTSSVYLLCDGGARRPLAGYKVYLLLSLRALPYKRANTDTPEALRGRESYRKRRAGQMLAAALLRRAACEHIARVRAASAALTARLRCALYTALRVRPAEVRANATALTYADVC